MTQSPGNNPSAIRITPEELASEHVDDLLKRQASLRGEGGITRSKKGKWYYQNWFIFMLVGTAAAVGAWALIEPFFDDMLYVQGPLEKIVTDEDMPPIFTSGREQFRLKAHMMGRIEIRGQKIWMPLGMKTLRSDGGKAILDLDSLKPGQTVGVYVEHMTKARYDINLAHFLVPDPPSDPPKKALLTLDALNARTTAAGMLLFAVVAGLIGLGIGAADGIVCRLFRRALLAGGVGLLVGLLGGLITNFLANLVYAPLNELAMKQEGDSAAGLSTFGFLIQMGGRSLAWCLAGMAMGLGQGIALRSQRLLLYGFLGGIIGGLLGGLLFDPIDLLLLGMDKPSAHWSRLVGIASVGAAVGAMIGLVELLARDAWLRMVEGPLAGKEFVIFKDTMHLGSSPRSEIYLFNDAEVAAQHAVIRSSGDTHEIENLCPDNPTCINGRAITRTRLRHGDQISIGRTVFTFQRRKG